MPGQQGHAGEKTTLELRSPSLQLAMIVADINMAGGSAEIWEGPTRIARVEKQSSAGAAYWKVN
jgi:hypothetical protein